ncbi:MAG: homoserine dehydrogenase [Deltaproteobacteria bacterium]|nr:homoserine dehydrogenase [Deltaproteobacteria bacterium]
MGERAIRIGLIGFGTIGTGVIKLLQRHRAMLRDKAGVALDLVRVADIDTRRDRGVRLAKGVLVNDARKLLDDPSIDVVVELMGGIGIAKRFVLEAIGAGKDVVTANKALLAHHGDEIFRAVERSGVGLGFEASVGGGIPIIRALKEGLAGDRNQAVYGIVNGTSNYILSRMSEEGGEFGEVLKAAQAGGLAEADPSFDVDGIDAAHKLTLLIQLAFGARCPVAPANIEGIRHVSQADIAFAREFGYAIKSLAVAKRAGDRIEASVRPTMVPRRHPLASVNGALNAIVVQGEALGPSMYTGAGAGMMPTATAVVADLMDVARNRVHGCRGRVAPLGYPVRSQVRARPVAPDELHGEFYLRFMVVDRPGGLGRIAGILGDHGVSIAAVMQREREHGRVVPVVIRTHDSAEQALRRAVRAIDRLAVVRGRSTVMRIEESLG